MAEEIPKNFETLQLHAGKSFRVVGIVKGPFTAVDCTII